MKLFRLHITRIYGFFLILIGIGLSIANITEQKAHHAAFTSWLGSHLKNDESEAHKKLDNLSNDQSELEEVIRKASEVVTSHADDFKLPVSEDEEASEELVYQLLLTQWNQFQNTEAGMSKAVIVETVKPQTILPNDGKSSNSDGISLKIPTPNTESIQAKTSDFSPNSSFLFSPLESGIAIGAP
jgi:hypothetical protein